MTTYLKESYTKHILYYTAKNNGRRIENQKHIVGIGEHSFWDGLTTYILSAKQNEL